MFKRSNFSIKQRLLFLLGFAILNVIAVGGISNYYLNHVVKTFGHVVDLNIPAMKALNEARAAQRDLVILTSVIVATDHAAEDPAKNKADFDKAVEKYEKAMEELGKLPPVAGEEKLRKEVELGWKAFIDASKKVLVLGNSEKPDDLAAKAKLAKGELSAGRKEFRESFQTIVDFHEEQSQKWGDAAEAAANTASRIVYSALFAGIGLVLLAGWKTANSLTAKLIAITEKISQASDTTSTTTQQVSSASEQLASSSAQQASSLQQTASSMEQINAMVTKNAESAQRAQSISETSKQSAVNGKEVVLTMVQSIEQISASNAQIGSQIEASNQEMGEIVKVINEIESKTKVINDIVFQTKLLSFNASVEAARAGEHGKGFAVVAEEVGNLAQMSGTAAQSITGILAEGTRRVQEIIQRSNSQINQLLSVSKEKLQAGVDTAEQCRQVLESLVDNVTQVNGMASDIAVASQEQSHGVKEINSAVAQLDTVVQQTNTASQDLSNASSSLLEQTGVLKNVVTELFSVVKGGSGNSEAA